MFLVSSAYHQCNCRSPVVEIPWRKIAGTLTWEQSDPITGLHASISFNQQVECQHRPHSAALWCGRTDFPRRRHENSLLLKYNPQHIYQDLLLRLVSLVYFPTWPRALNPHFHVRIVSFV